MLRLGCDKTNDLTIFVGFVLNSYCKKKWQEWKGGSKRPRRPQTLQSFCSHSLQEEEGCFLSKLHLCKHPSGSVHFGGGRDSCSTKLVIAHLHGVVLMLVVSEWMVLVVPMMVVSSCSGRSALSCGGGARNGGGNGHCCVLVVVPVDMLFVMVLLVVTVVALVLLALVFGAGSGA